VDKKAIIIESAIKRFRHYGISKTTMQEIAGDSNLAVGTLYLYFKNKDEIVVACADEYRKEHLRYIDQVLNSELIASEKIRAYTLNRFRANQQTRTGFAGNNAAEMTKAVIRVKPDRIDEESTWLIENITKILVQGNESCEFKVAEPAEDAEVFLYSIGYFFPMATYEVVKEPDEEMLNKVINWFIKTWKNK
jgi:TetR/AcrR family fatty acid metabolism transcriptional regulator